MEITSTKISGLAVDTEYVFYLVLRTSAGVYSSEKLSVRTHKMTDLSGITVTPGVLPAPLRESLTGAVERIGAKLAETVRIDTTHFVCTEGRGREWEKAAEMNIPVVRPEWIEGCEREGRIVGVRGYYLNADPRLRNPGPGVGVQKGIGSDQPQRPQMLQNRRTESQSTLPTTREKQQTPNPLKQNPPSPATLDAGRPAASPVSETGPPPLPAKDTPAQEPGTPSTVRRIESAEVRVTSPSVREEVSSSDEDEEPGRKEQSLPGDSTTSFTEVAL